MTNVAENAAQLADPCSDPQEQAPNSGEHSKWTSPPAPGSSDYDAWAHQTVADMLAAEQSAPPTSLVASVVQYEGVIARLRREKKSWPVIARLLESQGFRADADVLRITYNRVNDSRRPRVLKRIASVQPQTAPKSMQRSDSTSPRPATPSGTQPNLSGRIR